MNNALQVFTYDNKKIRTVEINGQAWFVGKDVAEALGYKLARKALRDHIEEEDKRRFQIRTQ